jgi:hypothetical protein
MTLQIVLYFVYCVQTEPFVYHRTLTHIPVVRQDFNGKKFKIFTNELNTIVCMMIRSCGLSHNSIQFYIGDSLSIVYSK